MRERDSYKTLISTTEIIFDLASLFIVASQLDRIPEEYALKPILLAKSSCALVLQLTPLPQIAARAVLNYDDYFFLFNV